MRNGSPRINTAAIDAINGLSMTNTIQSPIGSLWRAMKANVMAIKPNKPRRNNKHRIYIVLPKRDRSVRSVLSVPVYMKKLAKILCIQPLKNMTSQVSLKP
mmetsp:Transcript_10661/g.10735  ORF Transcript_10661/g.10735 Transcript_10661/m.10735 type:complete len:101 (-) Transcript_10661:139-441(-)